MMNFRIGELVDYEGRTHEVVQFSRAEVTFEPLTGGVSLTLSVDQVHQAYNDKKLTFHHQNTHDGLDDEHSFLLIPSHERDEALRRKAFIDEIERLSGGGEIPNAELLRIGHETTARLNSGRPTKDCRRPPGLASLRRWRQRWISSGKNIHALRPRYKDRGRARERTDPNVESIMQEVITTDYLTRRRPAAASSFKLVISRIQELNQQRDTHDQVLIPDLRTFLRRIEGIDVFIRDLERHGRAYALSKHKMSATNPRPATRPNEVWQADATCSDIFLYEILKPEQRLQRPNLTMIIDQYTRAPMGYYLCFDSPSVESIAGALKMGIEPKDWIHEHFPSISGEWRCFGLPEVLVCDNAMENHSEPLKSLCYKLGIELRFTSSRKPQEKPHIERLFGTINRKTHELPGSSFSNPVDRGQNNPQKEAGLTIADYEEWLVRVIVDDYLPSHHSALNTSPLDMWERAVADWPVRIPKESISDPAFYMREARRTLQRDGIHFDNLIYSSEELQGLYNAHKPVTLSIRYSMSDAGSIVVMDPVGQRSIIARCVSLPEYSDKLSRWRHRALCREVSTENRGKLRLHHLAAKISGIRVDIATRSAGNRRKLGQARSKNGRNEKAAPLNGKGNLIKRSRKTPSKSKPIFRPSDSDKIVSHKELPGGLKRPREN